MELIEKCIGESNVYKGRLLDVRCDTVALPNGHTSTREYIRHVGAVAIVALTNDGKIVMERQFRYPMGKVVYEIPAGKLDSKSEDPLCAAKRELEEETGLVANDWRYLGEFYPSSAYTDEVVRLFLATDMKEGTVHLDEDEFVEAETVELDEIAKLIVDGEIPDAKTQAAVMRVVYMKEHGLL